jgi:hypothetical protein
MFLQQCLDLKCFGIDLRVLTVIVFCCLFLLLAVVIVLSSIAVSKVKFPATGLVRPLETRKVMNSGIPRLSAL